MIKLTDPSYDGCVSILTGFLILNNNYSVSKSNRALALEVTTNVPVSYLVNHLYKNNVISSACMEILLHSP
jgi:hypothetical protein